MNQYLKSLSFSMSMLSIAMLSMPVMGAGSFEKSRQLVTKTNDSLQRSQVEIDKLHAKKTTLLEEFNATIEEANTYQTYNQQLEEIVQSQQSEISSIETQIQDIEVTSKQIMPLMARMIDALDEFIMQDLPFLPEERMERVKTLRDHMKRADLSIAEKYRKILEAYQIEIEYGNTLEAYQADLGKKMVTFLKVGRSAFYFQSIDKASAGVWNKHKNDWQILEDAAVKYSLSAAVKMARKQRSPELLIIHASHVEDAK